MKAKKTYKLIIAAIATTTLLFLGCSDLRTINKDFQGKEISFDLPMIPVSGDFDFSQRTPLNLKDQIEAIHIPLVTLKGFAVREVVIELKDSTAGQPITFDALDNLYLYIAGDSLPEVLIASKDPVPHTNSTILNMETNSGVNLLPYAKVPFVTYRVKGKSNRATEKAVKMSIRIKWRVTAEIL